MKKRLLITRPMHDDTTHYLSNWSNKALESACSHDIQVLDMFQERANSKEVCSILQKQNPNLVIFNGHGDDDKVAGHNNDILIQSGKNEELLKNKISYTISCRSGKTLGPKSVESGAKAYIGYDDDFIFFYEPNKISRPLQDETAKLFLEAPEKLVSTLVKGKTVDEACKRSKEIFKRNIMKLLSSEATAEEAGMARYLWWDMTHQVCFGDKEAYF